MLDFIIIKKSNYIFTHALLGGFHSLADRNLPNHFYLFIIKTLFIHSLWHFPISSLANFTLPGQITSSLVMILFSFEADKTFFHQYIMCHIIQFYICFIPLRSTCHLPLPPPAVFCMLPIPFRGDRRQRYCIRLHLPPPHAPKTESVSERSQYVFRKFYRSGK